MSGAIIRIDQDRPGPSVSSGTAGVARKDLWIGHVVRPTSTETNSSQTWVLLDKPAGSIATISDPNAVTCSFTPDIAGSYRVKLTTNAGGAGNEQILICGVTKDAAGTTTFRGWRIPAFGERAVEGNFSGNTRGWASALEEIIQGIDTIASTLSVSDATTLVKGIVQLAGDLRGTAAAPLVKSVSGDSGGTATGTYTKVDETGQTYMAQYRRPGSLVTGGAGANHDTVLLALNDNEGYTVEAEVSFQDATAAVVGLVKLTGQFYRSGGGATLKGTVDTTTKNDANLTASLVTSGNNIVLRLVDDAATVCYVGFEVYIQRTKTS